MNRAKSLLSKITTGTKSDKLVETLIPKLENLKHICQNNHHQAAPHPNPSKNPKSPF